MMDVTVGLSKIRATLRTAITITLMDLFDGVIPLETTVVVSHDTLDTELRCAGTWSHRFSTVEL